jgi:hypothetical protein
MTNVRDDSYEFVPSEYDVAAHRFFSTGVKALMEAQGGVYSLVSKESMEQLPDYSLPLPEDDALRGRPIEAISDIRIDYDDVIKGNFDGVLAAMDAIAIEMAGQITKAIMTHISEVCDRIGNVVTGELSYDVIAHVIENMDFSFDEEGNHNISVVVSSEGLEKLRALGPPTAEQQARIDAIIARKRDEWNARRGGRSLPPRRV